MFILSKHEIKCIAFRLTHWRAYDVLTSLARSIFWSVSGTDLCIWQTKIKRANNDLDMNQCKSTHAVLIAFFLFLAGFIYTATGVCYQPKFKRQSNNDGFTTVNKRIRKNILSTPLYTLSLFNIEKVELYHIWLTHRSAHPTLPKQSLELYGVP